MVSFLIIPASQQGYHMCFPSYPPEQVKGEMVRCSHTPAFQQVLFASFSISPTKLSRMVCSNLYPAQKSRLSEIDFHPGRKMEWSSCSPSYQKVGSSFSYPLHPPNLRGELRK